MRSRSLSCMALLSSPRFGGTLECERSSRSASVLSGFCATVSSAARVFSYTPGPVRKTRGNLTADIKWRWGVDTRTAACVTVCSVTQRNTHRRPLTELQQAILDQLWSTGPATADRIREALLPEHRLKDSSVRTLLRRLEMR